MRETSYVDDVYVRDGSSPSLVDVLCFDEWDDGLVEAWVAPGVPVEGLLDRPSLTDGLLGDYDSLHYTKGMETYLVLRRSALAGRDGWRRVPTCDHDRFCRLESTGRAPTYYVGDMRHCAARVLEELEFEAPPRDPTVATYHDGWCPPANARAFVVEHDDPKSRVLRALREHSSGGMSMDDLHDVLGRSVYARADLVALVAVLEVGGEVETNPDGTVSAGNVRRTSYVPRPRLR